MKTIFSSRIIFTIIVSAVLAACGSDGNERGGDPVTNPETPTIPENPSTPTETTLEERSVGYASIARIPLAEAGLPEQTTIDNVKIKEGTANSMAILDGELRWITPSDPGTASRIVIAVSGAREYILPVEIRSARSKSIEAHIEGSEEDGETPPPLIVTGLASDNSLQGNEIRFRVDGGPTIDPTSSVGRISTGTGFSIGLASYWNYDPASNSMVISAQKAQELISQLPSSELRVNVGLTDATADHAFSWSFKSYKPSAVIKGQITATDGSPITSLAGRFISIKGTDNGTRLLVTADDKGFFTAEGLIYGTYNVAIADVNYPDFWLATVPIFAGSTEVAVKLVYTNTTSLGIAAKPLAAGKQGRAAAVAYVSTTTQNGTPPKPRTQHSTNAKPLSATPSTCEHIDASANTVKYSATAGLQNSTVTCLGSYSIPQGTKQLYIVARVLTDEFPHYTQSKSQYNDQWSYAVAGIPSIGATTGLVNDSHYNQGSITKTACVDVSSQTATAAYSISASLTAINIGDSALPTSVEVSFSLSCDGSLRVTDAFFTSPNTKPYRVIKPTGGNNIEDDYISIPIATAFSDWGIPTTIKYEPADATITEVYIGLLRTGAEFMSTENLINQATTKEAGTIKFNNLKIPTLPVTRFSGRTNVILKLVGTINGNTVSSTPQDGQIRFNETLAFKPLFLADDVLGSARRTNGHRDVGGDSWATDTAIDWLLSRPYRFDDITGLHSPQYNVTTTCGGVSRAPGSSALCHSGHSDGAQIDMRYADGAGGHTDELGGQNKGSAIKELLAAAKVEAAGSGAGDTPKLNKAKSWIFANRSMIENEAGSADIIYVGKTWLWLALNGGQFEDGTQIPGVGSWSSKPLDKVSPAGGHHDHWHLSLSVN